MMDRQLKQRVVGAGLLVAFGVIFIPIFLDNGDVESPVPPSMNIPSPPTEDVSQRAPTLDDGAIAEMEAQADEDAELPPPRVQAGEGHDAELLPAVTPAAGGEPPLTVESLEEGLDATAPPETSDDTPPAEASAPRMLPPIPRSAPALGKGATVANSGRPVPTRPVAGKPVAIAQVETKPPPKSHTQTKSPVPVPTAAKLPAHQAGTEVKSPAARPPAPAPASVAGWTVQLGSFASEINARKLVDKLKTAGYRAYSEPRVEQHTTVFKVRVGPTPGKAEAERLRQRIEAQFDARGMLIPSH